MKINVNIQPVGGAPKWPIAKNIKQWSALLTQTGTDPPVPTILQNQIGTLIWTYHNPGDYRATCTGAFPEGKTKFILGGGPNVNVIYYPDRLDDDTIQLLTYNNGSAGNDWSRLSFTIQIYKEPQTT